MQKNSTHWIVTRVTSVPLALLSIYFLTQAEHLTSRVLMQFISWFQQPFVTAAAALFVVCAFWHAKLGMEEIIIDYVPEKKIQALALLVNKVLFLVLGVACLYAIFAISFKKV